MTGNHNAQGGSSAEGDNGVWFDDFDDGWLVKLQPQMIGLDTPFAPFVSIVNALMTLPANPVVAAGELNDTPNHSSLYWEYNRFTGLAVQASAGLLSGGPGNGGFSLDVLPDGSWALHFTGTDTTIGYNAVTGQHSTPTPPPPPAGNTVVNVAVNGADGGLNGSAGHLTINGDGSASNPVVGWDTIQGGVGDYMIGGDGSLGGGAAGKGNCAIFSRSPGSVLVDMENGNGYGGSAQGDVMVNMNQVRGSSFTDVLIGSASGTDLKSGANHSLLISTGGNGGYELRPDGYGNVLVSTVGADVFRFDPAHGLALCHDNIALAFNAAHGDSLDLSLIGSTFHTAAAAGYDPATGTGNISDYVAFVQRADGDHLMFNPTGNVQTAGIELLDMKETFGLSVSSLYQSHSLKL